VAECLEMDGSGRWKLTAKGEELKTPLSAREIEKIMEPGHRKWYKKSYSIPVGAKV